MSYWTVFSNHGHVLLCLARDPDARLRDVAADVGITERAVQKIVHDLKGGGMITISKQGRRNHYRIHRKKPLRHDLEAHCTFGDLVNLVVPKPVKPQVRSGPVLHTADSPESENSKPIERPQGSLF